MKCLYMYSDFTYQRSKIILCFSPVNMYKEKIFAILLKIFEKVVWFANCRVLKAVQITYVGLRHVGCLFSYLSHPFIPKLNFNSYEMEAENSDGVLYTIFFLRYL